MRLLRPDTLTNAQPDSWPPSPSRHPPSLDEDNNTSEEEPDMPPLLQEEPLTYFLTPATPKDEDRDFDFDFDFDAGIEDSSKPRDIVRSVSPSTLDGLKKYKPKSKASDCAILDDDDDGDDDDDDDEAYISFSPSKAVMLGYDDFFDHRRRRRPRSRSSPIKHSGGISPSVEDLLSPASSFHVGSPRGRPARRFAPPRRPFGERATVRRGGLPALQRRHSWREPSPDVWSIEEEPEKETMSEMGLSAEELRRRGLELDLDLDDVDPATAAGYYDVRRGKKTRPIDIPPPAAKLQKKVRFVLPIGE